MVSAWTDCYSSVKGNFQYLSILNYQLKEQPAIHPKQEIEGQALSSVTPIASNYWPGFRRPSLFLGFQLVLAAGVTAN